ncbi:MAG: Sua5/YciO/YrdC/YwlC family protein [Planctomycetota bacterium]
MVKTLGWKNSVDQRDLVHLIVQGLAEGQLIAVPTETTYQVAVSALHTEAVERVGSLVDQGILARPTLVLRSAQEAFDYSPNMSKIASRAVYRAWPGPLVLSLPISNAGGSEQAGRDVSLANQLPKVAQSLLLEEKGGERFLSQRVTSHPALSEPQRLTRGPLLIADCAAENGPVVGPEQVEELLGDTCKLLIDDGPTHFGGLATCVQVSESQCRLMEKGVIEPERLNRLFQLAILVVCTGNTCRSPMAEVLLRDLLKKRFPQFADEQQPRFHIASAGLSAYPGGPASVEAQVAMQKRGLSLRNHQSQAVTGQSLQQADLVLTMTRNHRAAILQQMPELENRVHLVSGSTEDVSDPFGGPEEVYEDCATQIEGFLESWVAKLDENWFSQWEV